MQASRAALFHAGQVGGGVGEGDVLSNRHPEQERVLHHDTELRAHAVAVQIGQVHLVEQDPPAVRRVQPEQ